MRKNKGAGILLKTGVLLFAVYAIYTIISLQVQIRNKRIELSDLTDTVEQQELKNAEIEAIIENADDPEYIAKVARDKLGYVTAGEKVFVNITD